MLLKSTDGIYTLGTIRNIPIVNEVRDSETGQKLLESARNSVKVKVPETPPTFTDPSLAQFGSVGVYFFFVIWGRNHALPCCPEDWEEGWKAWHDNLEWLMLVCGWEEKEQQSGELEESMVNSL
ncbi:hypothetical protein R1sor_018267 [Riccia sorocarpa]|uniref:Uncharacterized protein n=1 Tax=Riccia sorocarpa TaxID=122646 RepID=A0ABD3I967_9MARC